MLIRYKLTTQEATTHNGYKVPLNGDWYYPQQRLDTKITPCTDTALHHYSDPRLAIIFNPRHAHIHNPRLFEIEINCEAGTDGLKGWCTAQRVIRELPVPVISQEQLIAFAIYCAELCNTDNLKFMLWATNWMNGTDRSGTANAAAYAAAATANAAANATAAYAAYAAAATAAYAAAATAATAAYATAATAAYAAAATAATAAYATAATAAYAAAATNHPLPDFISIIDRVMNKKVI